jgi:hypothetical protein
LESTTTNPNEESTQPKDPAETPPNELNKPTGDAIPTPVEPGLDQPLPEKPTKKDDENRPEPLGVDDPPPGVPDPGPSDFA